MKCLQNILLPSQYPREKKRTKHRERHVPKGAPHLSFAKVISPWEETEFVPPQSGELGWSQSKHILRSLESQKCWVTERGCTLQSQMPRWNPHGTPLEAWCWSTAVSAARREDVLQPDPPPWCHAFFCLVPLHYDRLFDGLASASRTQLIPPTHQNQEELPSMSLLLVILWQLSV